LELLGLLVLVMLGWPGDAGGSTDYVGTTAGLTAAAGNSPGNNDH
jgi:hypothetical protein